MNPGVPTPPKTASDKRTGGKVGRRTSSTPKSSLTPAMQQYQEQKAEVGDAILLFRMGDFYETFYEDAKTASRVLGLTLTARNKSSDEPIPLAGVPYHAVDGYIAKLVRAGYKVALSEQIEDPKQAKGVVKRRVDRVITPGTLTDESLLDEHANNYLVAICPGQGPGARGSCGDGAFGLACVELASGRFFAHVLPSTALIDELARLRPAEVLAPEECASATLCSQLWETLGTTITPRPSHVFDAHMAERGLREHFGVASMAGFGFDLFDTSLCAAAAVLHYLKETQKSALNHILKIVPRHSERCVLIDQATLRSLEVERVLDSPLAALRRGRQGRDGGREGSLLGAIDMTVNPMGARRLREWLCFPLRDADEIRKRQEAIAELREDPDRLRRLRELLRAMGDVERILARLGVGRASPRDMVGLGLALGRCQELRIADGATVHLASRKSHQLQSQPLPHGRGSDLISHPASLLPRLVEATGGHDELAAFLAKALKEDAPPVVRDGGYIADGYDEALDRLRNVGREGHRWLAEFQAREAARTGIPTLKVGYNSVFGYYIEITHQHREKVPAEYIRKQTIRNAERYITDELKRHESEVLGAADKAKQLEADLFDEIRSRAAAELPRLQAMAEAIATFDVLAGLAELSRRRDYCRPELVDCGLSIDDCRLTGDSTRTGTQSSIVNHQSSMVLEVVDGRHPVLDVTLAERFVPNDCRLARDGDRLLVITGPNMAGKSTYIRQTALLVLLAQTGSFVPAAAMRWSPVDRIFTRVGASDELARGQSTFMVEMVETARILNNATEHSLVILDEIGRGTSTYDGLALAWAITEYIAEHVGCRTLFATHYHELTELAEQLSGVANFNVAVHEELRPDGAGRDVVFLHKIVPGATDRSYGIHVAAMAGLPASVLKRAEVILAGLEANFAGKSRSSALAAGRQTDSSQMLLFPDREPLPSWWRTLVDELDGVDIDRTTPLDALTVLRRLQWIVRNERMRDEG